VFIIRVTIIHRGELGLMDDFVKTIDVNEKLSVEHHVSLYLFELFNGKSNFKYEEDLIVTEGLIHNFNKFVSNSLQRERFIKFLRSKEDKINKFIENFNKEPWKFAKPIIWNDREKSSYYIKNLTLSHRFEVYIEKILEQKYNIPLGLYYSKEDQYNQGENELGIEIKRDICSWETGNLYIEYEERLNPKGKWVPSGIFKKDNTHYFLIGDIGRYYIIRKKDLLELYEIITKNHGKPYNGIELKEARRGTSLGFIIPLETADKISISLDKLAQELKDRLGGK
jgi:hypothetical protein